MSSQVQQPVSSTPLSYEPMSSGPEFKHVLARWHDRPIVPPAVADLPSATEIKTHAIVIAIAKPDPKEPALKGVEGDLPLILDELTARTNSTIQVITDLQLPESNPKAQRLLPTVRNVEDSIQKVGQAMKDGGLCYVFLTGYSHQDSPGTAYMPLASGEHLDGKVLTTWLEAAGSNGGTFVVIADVAFAASLIRLPFVCDVNDGQLAWRKSKNSEKEGPGKTAQVVALLATDCNQNAVTIDNGSKMPYPGWHGLFTWALFNCNFVRDGPLEVDLTKLLLHLRKHSAWHPTKPCPQMSATTEGERKLPIGRLSS